jgi:hypothetical protein
MANQENSVPFADEPRRLKSERRRVGESNGAASALHNGTPLVVGGSGRCGQGRMARPLSYPFCHGEPGAIGLSRIPMARSSTVNRVLVADQVARGSLPSGDL